MLGVALALQFWSQSWHWVQYSCCKLQIPQWRCCGGKVLVSWARFHEVMCTWDTPSFCSGIMFCVQVLVAICICPWHKGLLGNKYLLYFLLITASIGYGSQYVPLQCTTICMVNCFLVDKLRQLPCESRSQISLTISKVPLVWESSKGHLVVLRGFTLWWLFQ